MTNTTTITALLHNAERIPASVITSLIETHTDASTATQTIRELPIERLAGEGAVRIARRNTKWATAVAQRVTDADTQEAIVAGRPSKAAAEATVKNPNLGTGAATRVLEWAIGSRNLEVARAVLETGVLPLDVTVETLKNCNMLAGCDAWLTATTADDALIDAAATCSARTAASVIAATHQPGSAVGTGEWRRNVLEAVDTREDRRHVYTALFNGPDNATLTISDELIDGERLEHVLTELGTLPRPSPTSASVSPSTAAPNSGSGRTPSPNPRST